jgi:hypothetical protein
MTLTYIVDHSFLNLHLFLAPVVLSLSAISMDPLRNLLPFIQHHVMDDDVENHVAQLRATYLQLNAPTHGGSKPGKSPNRRRDFGRTNKLFYEDFFSETPHYSEAEFRSRYRMYRSVFIAIHDAVVEFDPWFRNRKDATNKWGASSYIKVAAAIRKLAYGTANPVWGELYKLSTTLVHYCVDRFITAIVTVMQDSVIRAPTLEECLHMSRENGERGFPGCLGSIDCQHWYWGMCPNAHHGHYIGKPGKPTVVLEAACGKNLRFSHADFGFPGSQNDLSIVTRSTFLARHIDGTFPPQGFTYTLNGVDSDKPYYLADGIYPRWSLFLQAIKQPMTAKEKLFTQFQESVRKDIKRAFGVMHKRWMILRQKSLLWTVDKMARAMYACIIMHNLIIDSYSSSGVTMDANLQAELDASQAEIMGEYNSSEHFRTATTESVREADINPDFSLFSHLHDETTGIMSAEAWLLLRGDVITHIWNARGDAL